MIKISMDVPEHGVGEGVGAMLGATLGESVGDREGVDVGTGSSFEKGFPCTVYWSSF